ncbi:cupin domain-containing protein [Candidatus Nitrosocosmicus arcticus]|uniref:Cupin-domain containing protein n=1 Tax=Candidatus Nitrosocosmicus arcticus TaxID=2035267 RepID=A0A557SU74_9ARCH|nr:cupin domain-containing protein [Candidatus Nitrosocosmicus arcticus]TVP40164.1 cupin-domain containing protein [Candidatus Nitrosocosmicus arcticus]
MKDKPFDFHGATFTIKVLTSETNGKYSILDVTYPPNMGPPSHMHPKGPETFYIIEGDYEFILDEEPVTGNSGDVIFIPKGTPHRFTVGNKGGHALIISPPELEFYFFKISELLSNDEVSYETESKIGEQYGQVFLDNSKHWN